MKFVMRLPILLLALLACRTLLAFDSFAWLDKRAMLIQEAERLRAVYSNCVARLSAPAEDVTIPVEIFEDGSTKVVAFAKKAQYFLDSGFVWAEGVLIRRFKEDGAEEARIEAQNCVFDRESKSGWADGRATVTHGKTVFSGRGVYFSSPEAYVRVFQDAEVESKDLKFGGMRP